MSNVFGIEDKMIYKWMLGFIDGFFIMDLFVFVCIRNNGIGV